MAVTLTKPAYTNVGEKTAHIKYQATGYSLPSTGYDSWSGSEPSSGSTWTQTRKVYSYSNLSYSWSFGSTSASGYNDFSISSGQVNTISATVTVFCTKTTSNQERHKTRSWIPGTPASGTPGEEGYKPATKGKWGNWSNWSTPTTTSTSTATHYLARRVSSNSIQVYAHPSEFDDWKNVKVNSIIESNTGLTAQSWNKLVTKTGQWKSWREQSNYYGNYSSANVSAGELISASKYNILAKALSVSQVTAPTDRTTGTLITADVFIALQTAVNA